MHKGHLRRASSCMYVLKEQVENELGKLEKDGVMKKTKKTCWANPTVATKG